MQPASGILLGEEEQGWRDEADQLAVKRFGHTTHRAKFAIQAHTGSEKMQEGAHSTKQQHCRLGYMATRAGITGTLIAQHGAAHCAVLQRVAQHAGATLMLQR
jgi:hypothetical protein